jgi:hypothetical protein
LEACTSISRACNLVSMPSYKHVTADRMHEHVKRSGEDVDTIQTSNESDLQPVIQLIHIEHVYLVSVISSLLK